MQLVSAILPTRGRQAMAARAIECFHEQNYELKELVILDDSGDLSFPNGVSHPQIQYHVSASRNIAEKRNECCRLAKGDYVCHFDSDDYSAPTRIADQVKLLEESGKAVTGFHSLVMHDEKTDLFYRWRGEPGTCPGTSFCYTREFWKSNPFEFPVGCDHGEDNLFRQKARYQIITIEGGLSMVASVHSGNTAPKHVHGYTRLSDTESQLIRDQWESRAALAH